jgi:sn-glycerol 3-phosphate transport system substrate-binding protein
MNRFRSILIAALAGAVVASACGGGSSTTKGTQPGKTAVNAADCGLSEFAKATKPVEVKFWHEMTRANSEWLNRETNKFNSSQHDVHVELVQFASYQDLLTKYLAGLSTKDLPDLFQPEDTTVQRMIDSRSVMPVQACVDADHYSLAKMLPRATGYFSFDKVLYGMPWTLSNPVLWYDKAVFVKAGLDPDKPPKTLEQVKEYSQKIVSSGAAKHGIALRVEPYIFEFLNAKSGATLVNNANGRDRKSVV